MTKQSWINPTRTLLLQCNWLSIEKLIVFHTVNLYIPFVQNLLASKSFMVRGPLVWNQILLEIRSCKSLVTFKRKYEGVGKVKC